MGKDKIRKFKENETFKCLIQPRMDEVIGKEHPLKGNWDKEVFHNGNPIVLELGCGKGEYTIALAERFPEKNHQGCQALERSEIRPRAQYAECGVSPYTDRLHRLAFRAGRGIGDMADLLGSPAQETQQETFQSHIPGAVLSFP